MWSQAEIQSKPLLVQPAPQRPHLVHVEVLLPDMGTEEDCHVGPHRKRGHRGEWSTDQNIAGPFPARETEPVRRTGRDCSTVWRCHAAGSTNALRSKRHRPLLRHGGDAGRRAPGRRPGARSSIWRSVSRRPPLRPEPAEAVAAGASEVGHPRLHRGGRPAGAAPGHRRLVRRTRYDLDVPDRADRGHHRGLRQLRTGIPGPVRRTASGWRCWSRAIRATATTWQALGIEVVTVPVGHDTSFPADRRPSWRRSAPIDGLIVASPVQPDRHRAPGRPVLADIVAWAEAGPGSGWWWMRSTTASPMTTGRPRPPCPSVTSR